MAKQISSLFPSIRIPLVYLSCLPTGVRFKRISTTGSVQMGGKPATSPFRGHIKPANFAATPVRWRFSLGNCFSSTPRKRSRPGSVIGTITLVGSLHTGTMTAMKVDLNSTAGDWREIKDFLLSQPVEVRRQYYKTDPIRLDDIPPWTHTGVSAGPEGSRYPRNEKLDGKISIYSGNITVLEVDAVVNAVDGAIHRGAGPLLMKECASLHGCHTGQAKVTCGYGLPAKYVIHTVGPIAQGGVGEAEKSALRSCYSNSLRKATENSARSVAFPCISTGIYGYPPEKAVHEALATVREYLDEHHDKLDRVIFCVFLPKDKELYLQNLPLYFPVDPTETPVTSKL
ncbi:ADP-ribose glycohydrolase MACROD1 isoform X2 [Dunckerocampus dactyliophorus]|uniref:ADP-ribose glycohydrolase MACROD1 isoform X2 n=1 Tax=Dunckerocampus dactyliophorus TaxID=161453 RepID=UPI002405A9DB|nr:ADP-ribose glycohydrolase MACROD1 isoform X2 [Dunckerocampus dactyliophorus]